MSRFNETSKGMPAIADTTNLAGGAAYSVSVEKEIITILLTSFLSADKFYEKSDETITRLKTLIQAGFYNTELIAKAIIYARTVYGMRTVTHVAAAELAKRISGKSWARRFWDKIIYRPDDMTEILAYLKANSNIVVKSKKRFPSIAALKKGFADAIGRFTSYQLAKYRSDNKDVKMVDVINFVHPPKYENTEAIEKLLKGELKQEETWEALLSAAGDNAVAKAEVWSGLLQRKQIGYLALLRNLRNIIEQAPNAIPMAVASLTDPGFIKKSLILPFQFLTAFEELNKLSHVLYSTQVRIVIAAIGKAIDISLNNVPVFDGSTLVVLDVSGSMTDKPRNTKTGRETIEPAKIGALFAAVIAKTNNADLMLFDNNARYVNYNPMDVTLTLANSIKFTGGGTNFPSIFQTVNKKYDRIIILSDMQGWMDDSGAYYGNARGFIDSYHNYKTKFSANPKVYSFDLAGYGTMQMPENNVYLLAGFSDKTMQLMAYLEKDKDALINEIRKIEL